MALFKIPALQKNIAPSSPAEGNVPIKPATQSLKTETGSPIFKLPKPIKSEASKPTKSSSSTPKKVLPTVPTDDSGLRLRLNEIFKNETCYLITTEEALVEYINKQEVFGLDTETSSLLWYNLTLAGFSLGTATDSMYVPLNHTKGQNYTGDRERLIQILLQKKYYGFNTKFDLLSMRTYDKRLFDLDFIGDGYLALRLTDCNLEASLKVAYKEHIDPTYKDYSFKSLFTRPFTEYDPAIVYQYAAVDARKHYVITEFFEEKIRPQEKVWKVYTKLELPLIKVVASMEIHGLRMDEPYLYKLKEELEASKAPILARIREIVAEKSPEMVDFNPGSTKQLLAAFKARGIPLTSTKEEVLKDIGDDDILAAEVLKYRGVAKSISSFTTGLLEYSAKEGDLVIAHPGFNTYGADTGRFSSSQFNVQQIPKDNRFRNIFIARPGHKLISVDYAQQEIRVLAALSKDPLMLSAFERGRDFYSDMGANVYDLPYEDCCKGGKHAYIRQASKPLVLGMNYDMGARSLAKSIKKTEREAQDILNSLRRKYVVMYQYKAKVLKFAQENGYNETVLGRRRYYEGLGYKVRGLDRYIVIGAGEQEAEIRALLPQLDRKEFKKFAEECGANKPNKIIVMDREVIAFAEQRQTTNSPVQGSSADMTKLALLVFYNDPRRLELKAELACQIHDEIIIEAPDEHAEAAGELLAEIMNGVGEDLVGIKMGGKPDIFDKWTKD